ncbi:putative leucine-rich repeat-containing protein, partial [Colletotrichum shisoi]
MRVVDPINVSLTYCAIIIGLRALVYALIKLSDLLYYLPDFPELPTVKTILMAAIGFWILAHVLLVVPFVFLCTINPAIRNFFPFFACSDELAMRLEERVFRYVTIAFVRYLNLGWQAFVVVVSFLYRTTAQLATSIIDKTVTQWTTEAVTSEPSLELVPSLTIEEQAAEARRCRLPGPVCDAARSQLEIKRREVNQLVRQLGEAEQRELDASGAVAAERETRRHLEQRLVRTEQQLTRYGPEANAVRNLELQLAESEARIGEANASTQTAERLLRTELEHSKWAVERKEAQAKKLHDDLRNVVQTAQERIGALKAEVGSLQRQLDSAKRVNTAVDVHALVAEKDETIQTLIAKKDETIQTLTEAGLAIEKNRNDKMEYAERMYASLIAENESLRRQLSDSTNDMQARENDADIVCLRAALTESHQKLQRIEGAFSEKQTNLDELSTLFQNNTIASDAEISSLRVALAESQQHVQMMEAALVKKKTKLEESETRLKSHVSVSENTINDAKGEVDRLRAELESQVTIERTAHANEINQASTIHTQQQQYITSLRSDLEVSNNEKMTLHQEISRLQELVQQHIASNSMNEGIEQQLAAVRNQHQADMNQANAVLATKDETIKQLQGRLEDSQQEIASLTGRVAEMDGGMGGEDFDDLEEKLRKALTNEKNNLERIADMEEELKQARGDEKKHIQEIAEMKKKRDVCEERDILAAGNGDQEELRNAIGIATYETAERDIRIGELEEKVASLEEQISSLQSESDDEQSDTTLGLIEDDKREGPADKEGSKKETQSNDDTEMEGSQPSAAKSTGAIDHVNNANDGDDESFEAAMNEAIDESNREYSARITATFTPDVQVPGVYNPFAQPS